MTKYPQEEKVRALVERMNEAFHERRYDDDWFYDALEARGCDIEGSALVAAAPTNGVWHGRIIRQDGRVFDFSIGQDRAKGYWHEVTDTFHRNVKAAWQNKPWDEDVVAFRYFRQRLVLN